MATNFPTGSDNFNIPNSPGSTALSSSGSGSRNHVQHHRDLGDAIEAMEAEATLAAHSHDSSTARHGNKLAQANTHQTPDTDAAAGSLHHTLGHLAAQAAPGNHASLPAFQDTHANSVSWPVGSVFISTSATNPSGALGGTWVAVEDAFLVGAGGSYSYTGSVVANASAHSHTIADTGSSSDGAHVHTPSGSIVAAGTHGHTNGGSSGASDVTHSHSNMFSGSAVGHATSDSGLAGGGTLGGSVSHGHTQTVNSSSTNHSHTLNDYNATADHGHAISSTLSSSAAHSHTASSASGTHLPTWKAFYVWRRTA